jgi:succinoglycan biosynthesis transport protein ExoP
MDLIYLFKSLMKRKWVIIASAILAAGLAWFLTQNAVKNFRSTSQVSTGFTVSDRIAIGDDNFDLYEAETKFNNAVVTITSQSVLNLLAYKLVLHDLESASPFRKLSESTKNDPVYKAVNKEQAKKVFAERSVSMKLLTSYKPEEKKLLEFMALYAYDYKSIIKKLNVYRLQKTDYIQIDFISENPELSAFVVNTLYEEFLRYYKKIRSTTTKESIDTLRTIMEKRKEELDFKNALLRGAGIASANMENTSTYDLISNFERSLAIEQANLTTLQASLRKVESRLNNTTANTQSPASTAPESNVKNDELILLRNSMNEAYRNYLASGSTDQALLARYNRLKKEYQTKVAETKPVVSEVEEKLPESRTELLARKNDIEIDIQTSIRNIASLQNKVNALRGVASSNAVKGASAETLVKEANQANNEYLDAKQKYTSAIETSSSAANNFRQILLGQPAINPEPSKRMLTIAMAGGGAFIMSVLLVIFISYLDSSIKTPGIFSKSVNLKLINMVNHMNLKGGTIGDIVAKKTDVASRDKNLHNVFRESLRKLRYEIENSGKKIFLFASTKKGQGKTTLITGLSYIFSMSKKKVLIIDTNFCNNDLTVYLGALPSLEQFSYDSSKPIVDQVKEKAYKLDENIHIIGCEAGDFTPSEVLPKDNLLKHLQELTGYFDYIFLEGAPLNDFSDAKELSQFVDGVIGVFSATNTIKQIDKESISFFKSLNGKYTGSILNMVDLENINTA